MTTTNDGRVNADDVERARGELMAREAAFDGVGTFMGPPDAMARMRRMAEIALSGDAMGEVRDLVSLARVRPDDSSRDYGPTPEYVVERARRYIRIIQRPDPMYVVSLLHPYRRLYAPAIIAMVSTDGDVYEERSSGGGRRGHLAYSRRQIPSVLCDMYGSFGWCRRGGGGSTITHAWIQIREQAVEDEIGGSGRSESADGNGDG